jgi:membrane protein
MTWSGALSAAVDGWFKHKSARLGAALAYYSVFSLGPLLLIVTSVAGLFFGEVAVRGALGDQFRALLGPSGSQAIEAMLKGASVPQAGATAGVVGVGLLIVAALGVVVQLKDALNTIWEVTEADQRGWGWYVRTYFISLAGILALGFLLSVSLVVSTALTAAGTWFGGEASAGVLWSAINFAVSLAVLGALFALLFRYFPDTEVGWDHAWPAAFATSLLFNVGKAAISLYIGSQGLESTYGAAASIVVLLIWVYYSSQIVLFGAEISRALADRHQTSIRDGA